MENTDIVDLVTDDDVVVGQALRKDCHGNPELIHRAVHVLLFNHREQLLLQKRSRNKDIQPGKWDTSVGGHLDVGEGYHAAAIREMAEELGISGIPLTMLYRSKIRNAVESENIQTYLTVFDGEIYFAVDEIDEVRFWTGDQIDAALGSSCFTSNFEEEWGMFNHWKRSYLADKDEKVFCSEDRIPDLIQGIND